MRFLATLLLVCISLCAVEARAEECVASHYGTGDGYGGRRTANGERMNPAAMTAAHKTLPFGTVVNVCRGRDVNVQAFVGTKSRNMPVTNGLDVTSTSAKNAQVGCVTVRINDRGPFVRGRCIDLSTAAMRKLCGRAGTCRVRVTR